MLSCVRHPNIVTLLGFCVEGFEKILVTENISNGYLAHYLGNFNNMLRTLTWEKRLKICIDVAHALNYLHFEMEDQKTIINFHISSRNIGLDENFGAKIVDFYFAVFLPPNQEDEALYIDMVGTPYYTDPEYVKSYKLKRESDVYGFGVVLLEILCGRLAKDPVYLKESKEGLVSVARRSFSMGTLEDMMDPTIKEETSENSFVLNRGPNKDSLHTFIKIANHCVAETQDQRPTMKVVVKELEKALFFQKNNKDNPKISLEDINQATQNFHKDNCIGRGGFGRVYRGNLQDGDGFKTIVAKQLDKKSDQGEQQFLCELQILLEYKHENIIGLVGYCDEKDEKIIVYEYASKGSLDRYLNNASLTWVKRLNICIDVASALDFLHGGVGKQSRVIHRDIKTANILVNDDWKAKLADFGLSLISPINQETDYVVDHVCGTPGYLDPLYRKTGFLTIESDIYSFGVVLFEILYGRSTYSIHKHRGDFLSGFIKNRFEEGKLDEVVFEQIREQIEPKSLTTFQKIAYKCLCHEREKRPSTKEVLAELKKALELQNMSSTMTKFSPLQIQLEDVLKATNNFHHDNINEHGGFGTTYKGQLMRSGRFMKIAAQRRGPCLEVTKASASVFNADERRLQGRGKGGQNMGIKKQGIRWQWSGEGFYNIGLDENWVAKIVDFGLSVFLPPNQEDEALYLKWIGKLSYTDPEYEMTETQDQRPTMKTVVKELEKALFFQVNIHAKSDYVEEKSHASITETQEVMLSTELNSMTMTGKSGNSEIHNEEKLLAMWIQESQDSQEGLHLLSQIFQIQMHKNE
ncbi:hypothetical protein L1987_61308 [Smallanthus sonchifolius]|uniref:Uncharacterized protein n=1 Tax=Smallanthus sonchifolius TaxID=185202 RepID=A0ACB9DB35_9ASTR|nr:hypothetical protein L1987_61308 [Smallanthus sonchifolius]